MGRAGWEGERRGRPGCSGGGFGAWGGMRVGRGLKRREEMEEDEDKECNL